MIFSLLKKLLQNQYYNTLKDQFLTGLTREHKWVIIRIMQCALYFHYLQCASVIRTKAHTEKSLKLFFSDQKNISIKDCQHEAYSISADLIGVISNIVVPTNKRDNINYLRSLYLEINIAKISENSRTIIASSCSSMAHMISIDDYIMHKKPTEKQDDALFRKADAINPKRLENRLSIA